MDRRIPEALSIRKWKLIVGGQHLPRPGREGAAVILAS